MTDIPATLMHATDAESASWLPCAVAFWTRREGGEILPVSTGASNIDLHGSSRLGAACDLRGFMDCVKACLRNLVAAGGTGEKLSVFGSQGWQLVARCRGIEGLARSLVEELGEIDVCWLGDCKTREISNVFAQDLLSVNGTVGEGTVSIVLFDQSSGGFFEVGKIVRGPRVVEFAGGIKQCLGRRNCG